ncbi:AraC family transcriptional regulator [Rhodococcus sp. BP-252]|uniref:AraC family transcriptional regulator n=1 Tax=unclassified Rhodococcus (in: high G+C Gram-positive bacteria) TaxID=192944 RepID=UPI001C9A7FCD|nr:MULTISPECIES: AraC family transcriptional regulator [unclassified Rhodococcus (in: high G+C Gram-positive bacteria)]MBY6414366.1 AraC family transcriptional regulator [Rhodococcus sp. BP-320]MBY6419503.1 AraC family transcriptional regulator [Rhodococcus sp. BP-321]MBY6424056.1 AraC family transcriptional regulator [Rhodococcus sp. BP-324]MBY6429267.1 AraC family transcriptional regulator [Rhodococcus sp. BP-323]MBY6434226.1 AraC family transcriptional regulator [Rhodococcus sp. BP-322]
MTNDARRDDSARTLRSVTFSTRDLGTREGRDAWARALDSTYCEMDLDWGDPRGRFDGELTGKQFGDLFVTTVTADPHTVVRTPASISSDERAHYLLCVVTAGHVHIRQDGRVSTLDGGAFAFLDPARPFVFRSDARFSQLVIRAPREALDSRLAIHDGSTITAQAISSNSGTGSIVSTFLQNIATLESDIVSRAAQSLSLSTLDMLVTSMNTELARTDRPTELRARHLHSYQTQLESTLHDPNVSLTDAAHATGMSLRYVQNLFRDIGTTPSAWLASHRLERARRLLTESDITVQEVSEASGFRDVSHFSRTFRKQFGMSPGRYRSASAGS